MEKIVSYCKDWFESYKPEGSPIEQALWIFWAVWVLLILIAVVRVIKFRLNLRREIKIWGDGSGPQKTAVVIVPIKGVTPRHTSDFFQSLLDQNYSNYRIIVAVEASDDPAAEWLSDQFGISLSNPVWAPENPGNGLKNLQLVVAGKCKGRGQKVHNQLAAFENLTAEDEIVAFADADIICPPDWLARLTAPINRRTHDLATTYRWLVPAKTRLVNLFASVMNASVTTQGGNVRENMPWGGSMAISRLAFNDVDVPVLFDGSMNDDLRLGKAAKKAGYKVGYVRNLVRPTEIDFTWPKFLEFARRQYFQAKVYAPILYFCGNVVFAIYFLGFVSIVVAIAMGYLWAWVPLIIATLLDQIRAVTRESIYRKLFGEYPDIYRRIDKTSIIEHLLTPLYMSLHGLIVLSTWFMNKVEWGGIWYQVEGVDKTRVLKRLPVESIVNRASIGELALPAGGVFTALAAAGGAKVLAEMSGSRAERTVIGTTSSGEREKVAVTTVDDTVPISVSDLKDVSQAVAAESVGEPENQNFSDPVRLDEEKVEAEEPRKPLPVPVGACQFTVEDVIGSTAAVAAGIIATAEGFELPANHADGSWEDFGEEVASDDENLIDAETKVGVLEGTEEVVKKEDKSFTFLKLGEKGEADDSDLSGLSSNLALLEESKGLQADSEVEDSEVEDSEVEDSEVEDSEVEDSEVEDSEVEDSEVEDSEVEDSEVEDRSEKRVASVLAAGVAAVPGLLIKKNGKDFVGKGDEVNHDGKANLSSVAVSAVSGVSSAVEIMGKGAKLPWKTRFRPQGISSLSRFHKEPNGKTYLAKREEMSLHQIVRLKRRKR